MKNFCYQSSEHDCGYASLKMLFAIISKNKNYLYLPKGEQKEHFSFLDLIEIAATHQVNLTGYELEFGKLKEQHLPILIQLSGKHMVVLTKIHKDIYYISDPARGKIRMRHEELQRIYDKRALIVENENLDRKYKVDKPRLMPKTYGVVHVVVALLIVGMLGLDFYLMNLSENVPFIFMLIMFLIMIEVFENWYLFKMSDYFDEKYIQLYFKSSQNQNNEEYQKYLAVKVNLFQSSKSLVVFASLALILGILVSINDPKNILVIAIIALYKALEKYITQRSDEKVVHEMNCQESIAFDHQDQVVSTLINLNKRSNHYGMMITTRNCFFQMILMLLTLFMMVLSKTMSANFAVFHFGVYFVIGQGISLLFDRLTNTQEQKKNLTQFYDKCGL